MTFSNYFFWDARVTPKGGLTRHFKQLGLEWAQGSLVVFHSTTSWVSPGKGFRNLCYFLNFSLQSLQPKLSFLSKTVMTGPSKGINSIRLNNKLQFHSQRSYSEYRWPLLYRRLLHQNCSPDLLLSNLFCFRSTLRDSFLPDKWNFYSRKVNRLAEDSRRGQTIKTAG